MTVPNVMKPGIGRSRGLVRSLALGLLLGLGAVGAGSTLVEAADDAGVLEFLLGEVPRSLGLPARAPRPQAALRERRVRWTSRPAHATVEAPRWVTPVHRARASSPQASSPKAAPPRPRPRLAIEQPGEPAGSARSQDGRHDRTVCVRTCDGYMFPLANLEGREALPAHQEACQAACPGAETALYTVRAGQELDRAVSLDGRPYRSLAAAYIYRTRQVQSCACRPGEGGYARLLLHDATLRPGDAVAAGPGPGPSAPRSSPVATGPGRRASSSSAAPERSRPGPGAISTAPSTSRARSAPGPSSSARSPRPPRARARPDACATPRAPWALPKW